MDEEKSFSPQYSSTKMHPKLHISIDTDGWVTWHSASLSSKSFANSWDDKRPFLCKQNLFQRILSGASYPLLWHIPICWKGEERLHCQVENLYFERCTQIFAQATFLLRPHTLLPSCSRANKWKLSLSNFGGGDIPHPGWSKVSKTINNTWELSRK